MVVFGFGVGALVLDGRLPRRVGPGAVWGLSRVSVIAALLSKDSDSDSSDAVSRSWQLAQCQWRALAAGSEEGLGIGSTSGALTAGAFSGPAASGHDKLSSKAWAVSVLWAVT